MKNKLTADTRFALDAADQTRTATQSGLKKFSNACRRKFNELKDRLTNNLANEFAGVLRPETIRQVMNEADALAAFTPFPALFLPALAEEKVLLASRWKQRQLDIHMRSLMLAA